MDESFPLYQKKSPTNVGGLLTPFDLHKHAGKHFQNHKFKPNNEGETKL